MWSHLWKRTHRHGYWDGLVLRFQSFDIPTSLYMIRHHNLAHIYAYMRGTRLFVAHALGCGSETSVTGKQA